MIIVANSNEKYLLMARDEQSNNWITPDQCLTKKEIHDLLVDNKFQLSEIDAAIAESERFGIGYIPEADSPLHKVNEELDRIRRSGGN